MKSFKEWMATDPQAAAVPAQAPVQTAAAPKQKKWKATKDEIVSFWQSLRPDTPIQMTPVRYDHKGTSYAEDGVRITGSKEFIASVLPRLKEFLNFESPTTKLQLVYRETDSPSKTLADNKTSFVFYIQAKERGTGQGSSDVPKLPKPKKVAPPKAPTF